MAMIAEKIRQKGDRSARQYVIKLEVGAEKSSLRKRHLSRELKEARE